MGVKIMKDEALTSIPNSKENLETQSNPDSQNVEKLENSQNFQNKDKTTGDKYITEKNLVEIIQKINENLGDENLKDIIEQQKEALETLKKEFEAQLADKNKTIEELQDQINDLLINQPINPDDPTIGATLVEIKKQLDSLKAQVTQEAQEQESLKEQIDNNTQQDTANKEAIDKEIADIKERLDNITNDLSPDFVIDNILSDPSKAQEIIQEILKNPHNFPPFNLNPLVDANSDIFAQVRETLNTSRELLRLLATLEYISKDFQDDVSKYKEQMKEAIEEILKERDKALNQFKDLIESLESELKNIDIVMKSMQSEKTQYQLLKDDMQYLYKETQSYYFLANDYASFCLNMKNDCITLRDDMKSIQLDIESIRTDSKHYRDEVEFWHTSLINMGYDKLVAKVNSLESMINNMAEQKREEVLEAIKILANQCLKELKETYLDFQASLIGLKNETHKDLNELLDSILESIDDKKLASLDEINITTLSSLASIQAAKGIATDLIKYVTDECIEELTQHKSDYIVELQDIKTDAINSINENFAGSGKGFMAEMTRINNEIVALKKGLVAFGKTFKNEVITSSQTWTTPNDETTRNYFILLQGASGSDNAETAGGATSFGSYKSVNGGQGNKAGRGNNGDSGFIVLTLPPNKAIEVTIGTGRSNGFVSISYATDSN